MKNETLIKKTTSSKSGAINGILPGHNLKTNHYLLIVKSRNMRNVKMLRISLVLLCTLFLLLGCNSEDCTNDICQVSKNVITTRSTSIEWGRVRGKLIGRTLIVEWNCPTGNEGVGMLFSLYSSVYGLVTNFETFYNQPSGIYSMELPERFSFSSNESFYLEVRDNFSEPIYVDLLPSDEGYCGESAPKCSHKFSDDNRYCLLNLKANLSGSQIAGTIGALVYKPCRFIMRYTYREIIREKSYTGYLCYDFTSPVSYYKTLDLPWNDAMHILSCHSTSIHCELRIYDLICNKFIPNPECGFIHDSTSCQNYLRVEFTADIINGSFSFPDTLEEVR
ncbi:hypothetical protein [Bacteroides thetaiotaomicron]|uniref:hypothetical protein n=1 Tax=Bacteroides thetaiotaomicron TaxID=818 RepID=UPI00356197BA